MQERRKTVLALTGILLSLLFFGLAYSGIASRDTGDPAKPAVSRDAAGECSGCHEMKPEILTWQVSSHSKIPCTACHDVKPEDFKAAHESNSFKKPIEISEAIPNSMCEECHSSNRTATVSGDLIIPHDRHAEAGVACVKCHSGVVHAKIAQRGLTNGSYEEWDLNKAKQASTKHYLQPSMWTCIGCHKQAKVTRKCSACHTSIPGLPSHDDPSWKTGHGKTARTNIGDCTKCHVTPGLPQFAEPSTGDKAADFARAQEFCYKCHLERPAMHENSMVSIHPAKAAERGVLNCLTCHDKNAPKPGANVTGTYCNQCHWMPDTPQETKQNTPTNG